MKKTIEYKSAKLFQQTFHRFLYNVSHADAPHRAQLAASNTKACEYSIACLRTRSLSPLFSPSVVEGKSRRMEKERISSPPPPISRTHKLLDKIAEQRKEICFRVFSSRFKKAFVHLQQTRLRRKKKNILHHGSPDVLIIYYPSYLTELSYVSTACLSVREMYCSQIQDNYFCTAFYADPLCLLLTLSSKLVHSGVTALQVSTSIASVCLPCRVKHSSCITFQ